MTGSVPPLLSVRDLRVSVRVGDQDVPLLRDGTFTVEHGQVVCLVGESGSGKSVLARTVMGLTQRDASMTVSGSVRLEGAELVGRPEAELRELRGRQLSMIFQEPMSSLDPVYSVRSQMREAVRRRRHLRGPALDAHLVELLRRVGINDGARVLDRHPFELSGGMCQRVMIAMGLAGEPQLLIADEPTTALDVTIQAQILDLVEDLQDRAAMSMLMVTHDMGVAARVADRIVVMYAGRIVEDGTPEQIFRAPRHPYTRGLLSCMPTLHGPRRHLLTSIPGSVPSPAQLPGGCAFHPRCPLATSRCAGEDPALEARPDGAVACWHPVDRPHTLGASA
ncbi:MAG TPA: ABC transporter ATP-binding protein [Cellulomonas sp.]